MSDAPDAARALDQASGAAVHRRREGERASEGLNKRHSEDARGQIQNVGGRPEQVGPEQAWPLVAFSSWRRGRGRPARSQRRAGVTHVWVPLHLDENVSGRKRRFSNNRNSFIVDAVLRDTESYF